MKGFRKHAAILAALFCLTACVGGKVDTLPSGSNTIESGESVTQTAAPDRMAVLKIDTINTGKDAMDFVTKPVNSFVANSIASWTPGYVIPPAPYYEDCTVTLTGADNSALLSAVNAQVKVRGNWTTTYDKKPLRIKFEEKQNMLGLNGGEELKNWVLFAEYKDGSMLRNKTALSISREILEKDGLYASDSEFVEVYINNDYRGVYLLAEYQQANSARVDISEPEIGYTGTDIGYFLEFDGNYKNEDSLHSFHVDYADNAPLVPFDGEGGGGRTMRCLPTGGGDRKKDVGMVIKSDVYSQEQHDFIAQYISNVYRIMYSAAYEDKALVFNSEYTELTETDSITPREAVDRVVDVQSLADMYIISELTCDADIYWSSFFMDVDFAEGADRLLRFEAPWDFDSSMGNKDRCADGTGFYAANIVPDVNANEYFTINPWLAVLMNEEWYREIITKTWTEAYDSGVFERGAKLIETDAEKYRAAFERNYSKWNNLSDKSAFANELSADAASCKTHGEAAEYLADWLNNRVEFLNAYWHA